MYKLLKPIVMVGALWIATSVTCQLMAQEEPFPITRNDGTSWPTLHGDLCRSGFYPHFPDGTLKLAWRNSVHRELSGPRCEVIVDSGMAFMGTYAGNMYAWDAETGAACWTFKADGPIGCSGMVVDGTLYFGSLDRCLYAVKIDDGTLRWKSMATAGIWTSPVVHAGRVMFGDRSGTFRVLSTADGRRLWDCSTGDRILTTAVLTPDGRRVIFGSEDMHLYCHDVVTGELLWTSRKLPGLSLRDYSPVVVGSLVLVTTNPVLGFHETLDKHQRFLLQRVGHSTDESEYRYVAGTPSDVVDEQDAIVRYLRSHPSEQTFFAFDVENGREPWIAPLLYTAGLHNPPTPPCYDPTTNATYTLVRSAFTTWDGGSEVRPLTGVGQLDLQTGRVALLEHGYSSKNPGRPPGRKDMPWGTFNTIGDETQSLSCSPRYLFSNHQGYLGAFQFADRSCAKLFGKRDTYGGFFGPGVFGYEDQGGLEKARQADEPYGIVNEWHGPAKSIASVVGPRVYYSVGSQVLCFEGR